MEPDGPRVPGRQGHEAMGHWLDSLLRTRADTVLRDSWSHRLEGPKLMRLSLGRRQPPWARMGLAQEIESCYRNSRFTGSRVP